MAFPPKVLTWEIKKSSNLTQACRNNSEFNFLLFWMDSMQDKFQLLFKHFLRFFSHKFSSLTQKTKEFSEVMLICLVLHVVFWHQRVNALDYQFSIISTSLRRRFACSIACGAQLARTSYRFGVVVFFSFHAGLGIAVAKYDRYLCTSGVYTNWMVGFFVREFPIGDF